MLPHAGITRVILQGEMTVSSIPADKNLAAIRPVCESATCMPAAPTLPELYDAHAAGLFHYFTSFTGEEADAKDLLQELFRDIVGRRDFRDPQLLATEGFTET